MLLKSAQHCHNCFTARRYASAILAMALCLSVSVTSWCSIETSRLIELVFAIELPFTYSILTQGNSGIYKIWVPYFFLELCPKPWS